MRSNFFKDLASYPKKWQKSRDQSKFRKSYAQVYIPTNQHSKFGLIPSSRFLKIVDEKKGGRRRKKKEERRKN